MNSSHHHSPQFNPQLRVGLITFAVFLWGCLFATVLKAADEASCEKWFYTQRLALRIMGSEDADQILQHLQHPEINSWLETQIDTELLLAMLSHRGKRIFLPSLNMLAQPVRTIVATYGIYLNHELIGLLSEQLQDGLPPFVGISILPRYWRTGYAREALSLLINALFVHGKHFEILSRVHNDNSASIAFMISMGFKPHARLSDSPTVKAYRLTKPVWDEKSRPKAAPLPEPIDNQDYLGSEQSY